MTLGVMQPYLFPYIGYFQYIAYVDKLVMYDDVAFIKQGWINRNRILLNGKDFMFTVQLKNASSFKLIKDTEIDSRFYADWKSKFYKTVEQAYKKAPYFSSIFSLINKVFESEDKSISRLAINSIKEVCSFLEIKTTCLNTSVTFNNRHLTGQARIIDICKQQKATRYINLKGGVDLYSKKDFADNNMVLSFIGSKPFQYQQYNNEFISGLSIIDVMMFNTADEIKLMLPQYEII